MSKVAEVCLTEAARNHIIAEGRWLARPGQDEETFCALFFNRDGETVGCYRETSHERRRCTVDQNQLWAEAVGSGAAAMWSCHSHLQDDLYSEAMSRHWASACEPSKADHEFVRWLREGCKELEIAFIDHNIVGPSSIAYSFAGAAERGY